jgi:S1-C subfamily serine protease
VFALAGLRVRQERVPRLGVVTQMDPNGIVVVSSVGNGSSAGAAGVKPGDYLISVGDIAVNDNQFGAKMRAKYGASEDATPLSIKVRRNEEVLMLAGKLQFGAGDSIVEANPSANPKAVRVRTGLLRGTTGS